MLDLSQRPCPAGEEVEHLVDLSGRSYCKEHGQVMDGTEKGV